MPCETHFGLDLHRRNCGSQIAHANQIVGRARETEDPIHATNPAMANFPHQRNRLQYETSANVANILFDLSEHTTLLRPGSRRSGSGSNSIPILGGTLDHCHDDTRRDSMPGNVRNVRCPIFISLDYVDEVAAYHTRRQSRTEEERHGPRLTG